MKAVLYNRYVNHKWSLLGFILISSIFISTVLYPSIASRSWNFMFWLGLLFFSKQGNLEWVLPVSRNIRIKAYLLEAGIIMGISSVVAVVFNMIGNPPVQLLSVIAVWFAMFGVYSLLLSLPPANIVSSGYRTLLIIVEFAFLIYFFVFVHELAVIESYKVFALECLLMVCVWAVLMATHTRCYEKWGHEIRFL